MPSDAEPPSDAADELVYFRHYAELSRHAARPAAELPMSRAPLLLFTPPS